MKRLSLFLFLLASVQGFAQTVYGDFDMTNYPEISFVWNEYNPEIKDSTQFVLTSGNEKIPFRLQNLSTKDSIQPSKTILFLWEDLNHRQHAGQSDFTRAILYRFLTDSILQPEDKFNVAVFDRKGGNDLGSSIHTWISDGFTSNHNQLAEAVRNYKPKYDFFSNQANSELYMAIEEGIEMLQKEPSDRIRAIVVFTAGSNQDSYGGRNSIDENRALSLKIPIYAVKYPIAGCEHCTNIDVICRKTYGLEITTDDTALASGLLRECYGKIAGRHYGRDYRISFSVAYPRDGKQHAFVLNVSGKEYPVSFTTPAFSLKIWVKENVLRSVLIGMGLLLVIALAIFFIYRKTKKRRKELAEIEILQQETLQKAEKNRQELDSYKQQQADDKRKNRKEEFAKLMQTKNLLPRLQYRLGDERKSHTIIKPETAIGRDEDNDLVLLNDSISRHHAKIIFNGSGFEIQDLGSTNKVIVNGAFVERAMLNNSDIIGLGEITVHFFV
jgi:hypothetical protein